MYVSKEDYAYVSEQMAKEVQLAEAWQFLQTQLKLTCFFVSAFS